jgi:UPF0271 protein
MDRIDLNADLGEGYGPWAMGDDAAMFALVSSASIACGGHAGDPETMAASLAQARRHGVSVGAHPGYADRQGFGRRVIPMAPDAIGRMVAAQAGSLIALAGLEGARVGYVKPHGALANLAADDPAVAAAIVAAVARLPGAPALLAIAGTCLQTAAEAAGLPVFAEVFADRAYLPTGRLVPRSHPQALLHDPAAALDRLLRFLETGLMPALDGPAVALPAQSVCVHGDTPGAVALARALREGLETRGIAVRPFLPA